MGENEQGGMLRNVVVIGLIALIAGLSIFGVVRVKADMQRHTTEASSSAQNEIDKESYENSGNPTITNYRVWGRDPVYGYDELHYGQYGDLTNDNQQGYWSKIAHSDNGYAISFREFFDGNTYQSSGNITKYQLHVGWSNTSHQWKSDVYDDWGNQVNGVHYNNDLKRVEKN